MYKIEKTKIKVLESNPEIDLTTLENNIINIENNYDTLNSNSYKLSNTRCIYYDISRYKKYFN